MKYFKLHTLLIIILIAVVYFIDNSWKLPVFLFSILASTPFFISKFKRLKNEDRVNGTQFFHEFYLELLYSFLLALAITTLAYFAVGAVSLMLT